MKKTRGDCAKVKSCRPLVITLKRNSLVVALNNIKLIPVRFEANTQQLVRDQFFVPGQCFVVCQLNMFDLKET